VVPAEFSNSLLDDFAPRPGEGSHLALVRAGQSFYVGELGTQVGREALDDLGSLALGALALHDEPTELGVAHSCFGLGE
jgi:hypothetical protein